MVINYTEDNRIVHGLWIGKTLSILELLTINSFIANGHKFWLWTYQPLDNKVPNNVILKDANEIIPENKVFSYRNRNQYGHGKGSYAGFSDIFRYALLYKYGGWWTDMDVTCLKPLNFSEPYVFRSHHIFHVVGNLIKCPANSALMENCLQEAKSNINSENRNWNKPLEILNNNIIKYKLQKYIHYLCPPDQWRVIRKFLKNNVTLSDEYFAIHWINEEWRRLKLNKTTVIYNSYFYQLLKKYNIKLERSKCIKKIIFQYKLSLIHSVLTILINSPIAFIKALITLKS